MDLLSNFLLDMTTFWDKQDRNWTSFSALFFDQMTIYINLQGLISIFYFENF